MKAITSFVLLALFSASASATVNIDTVPVGDLGNANDPATGNLYGGVNYAYSIDKYEVTVGQYTAFLNAVAATDTYNLYNLSMASDANIAGIAQNCATGCTYSVIGSSLHPVTYVSWGDAARFANWLHNGQPTGAQNASTTEDGAYTLHGATSSAALNAVSRNANAQWFIPSESEWYKAAYHQPAAQSGDSDNYWNYPMKTNSVPYSDQPPGATPDNTRVGNFYKDDGTANGYDDGYAVTGSTIRLTYQNYLTDVGAYSSSPSYYGTFDQGGNVEEWNEALISGSFRGVRGGSVFGDADSLPASDRIDYLDPTNEYPGVGFRVASTPEPSTLLLAALALVPFAWRTRADRNRLRRFAKKFRSAGLLIALVVISSDNMANCSFAALVRIQDNSIVANGAAPQDGFNVTRDTSTGLDWLDLTLSTNRSFDDVLAQLGVGGDFAGFRVATDVEIGGLYLSAGAPVTNGYLSPNDSPVKLLISAVGANQFYDAGPAGSGFRNPNTAPLGNRSVSQYADFVPQNGGPFVFVSAGHLPDAASANNGTWLVRNIAVPEPSTLLLSVVAVVGLALLCHRL